METRDKLASALIQYDEKQRNRRGYNRFAIGLYLQALDNVEEDIKSGCTIRKALTNNYNGRLLDVLLRAIGEPVSTKQEQMF